MASNYVSPALSSKVAIAAKSNPVLANLLHAVLNHTATEDQVKTLGLLIHSLPDTDPSESLDPLASTPVREKSPKPFDIVFEFGENTSDKWIFPRSDALCERVGVEDNTFARISDIRITTSVPFAGTPGAETSAPDQSSSVVTPEVVSFCFARAPQSLWELFVVWAGGPTKMAESRAKLIDMVRSVVCVTGYASHPSS